MRVYAVCQDELVIRSLDDVLLPSFEVDFLVESRPLARRLHEAGINITAGDPRRVDTYLKADISPSTCFIVQNNGRRSVRKILSAIRDAGGTLTYVLHTGPQNQKAADELKAEFTDLADLELAELIRPTLVTELSRSMTRARVQQYQRYFADADKRPHPAAQRSRSRRARQRAGAAQPAAADEDHGDHRRRAGRDAAGEPADGEHARHPRRADHAGVVRRVRADRHRRRAAALFRRPARSAPISSSITIPEQPGYSAVFKDIRADYGSTCTILTEHLRAVDVNISERTATAMLYAIKSDTLFFARHTNRVDLEAFTFLYPLADAALIRKMEGAEITLERLDYVNRASQGGLMRDQVFSAFIGEAPREDFIPYTADFFLQLEDVKWTIIAGVVGTTLIDQRAGTSATRATPASS